MNLIVNKAGTYTDAKGPNAKVRAQAFAEQNAFGSVSAFTISMIARSNAGSIQGHMGIKIQRVGGDGAVIVNHSCDGEVATPAVSEIIAAVHVSHGASDLVTEGSIYGDTQYPHASTVTLTPGNYRLTAKFSGFCDLNNNVQSYLSRESDLLTWLSNIQNSGSAMIQGKGGGQIVEVVDFTITA